MGPALVSYDECNSMSDVHPVAKGVVMVVEDDPDIRMLLVDSLTDGGFNVVQAVGR